MNAKTLDQFGAAQPENEKAIRPERPTNPVAAFRQQVESRQTEFAAALPAHIPAERFVRVILTAVNKNPDLLHADRASLFSSAMMSAADGLLCDGREAALVIYNTKKKNHEGRDEWVKAVQYMPMVGGILKKVRNSGELSTIVAKVVYAGDKFRNWIDDDGEHLEYEAGDDQDREVVRCAFAMAKLKDGAIEVEVLKPADIEKIRNASKSKDRGPWVDWWEEMAKKSAIRRLSKRLPLNTDLDDLIRRDDNLYDFNAAREAAQANQPRSLGSNVNKLIPIHRPETVIDSATGEVIENGGPTDANGEAGRGQAANTATDSAVDQAAKAKSAEGVSPTAQPSEAGRTAGDASASGPATSTQHSDASKDNAGSAQVDNGDKKDSKPKADSKADAPKAPTNEREYLAHAQSWIEAITDAAAGEKQWASEKQLRNKANVGPDAREALSERLAEKCREVREADKH